MHVDVSMHPHLLRTGRRAAEVDPAVDTVELEIERSAVRTVGFAMPAPAVEEAMGTGADPLFVHKVNICRAGVRRQALGVRLSLLLPTPDA